MLDIYIVDVWELQKARLYDENLSVPQSQCQNSSGELGDVGGGGRLRCLHGKVDTTINVCVHVVLAPLSVLGAWCYGCHLSVIIIILFILSLSIFISKFHGSICTLLAHNSEKMC